MADRPVLVLFTAHAERRCAEFHCGRRTVADLVLSEHDSRRRNPGGADWLVRGAGVVVAYNWPDRGDPSVARVVTLWPQR
jgi:hypothetical protein